MAKKTLTLSLAVLAASAAMLGAAGTPSALASAPARAQQPTVPAGNGPDIFVETPTIDWGEPAGGALPYSWYARVENPNDRPVLVKVDLNFVDEQGQLIQQDSVSGHVGPRSDAILQQNGTISATAFDYVAEARGVTTSWWADEPYQIRTLAAFVDGLQRIEVFFVLEDWEGRPVTAGGTVDLYIVERERLQAEFAGGGMRRNNKTLYARRFNVSTADYERRRIGFISTDYTPPALTLGPIHYSIFDHEPRGNEGLVRVVFRTSSGAEIVAEDRVFF
jgi:hypothetical protein